MMLPETGFSMPGQKDGRGILDLLEALAGHGEHAQLVDRAKAVLDRAHHAVAAAAVALEIQHGIHHVLEHARAGQRAFLGHVSHQHDAAPIFLGPAHQCRGGLPNLRDGARRGFQRLHVHRLDRIDHQQPGFLLVSVTEDLADRRLGQAADALQRQFEPPRAHAQLLQRLLAR